jgi:ATP-binding cassette subfamily B (MDR/TAP) protein 1
MGFVVEVTSAALTSIAVAFYFSWSLTLVILAFVPLTILALWFVARSLQPAIEQQNVDLNLASRCSHSAIKSIVTVKAFNSNALEVERYSSAIAAAAKSYRVQARANALQMGVTKFMTLATIVVGFWYGITLVKNGLSPGNILTTFYSCLIAIQAAEQLLPQWLVLTKGIAAGNALHKDFCDFSKGQEPRAGSLSPAYCRGEVEIVNVSSGRT